MLDGIWHIDQMPQPAELNVEAEKDGTGIHDVPGIFCHLVWTFGKVAFGNQWLLRGIVCFFSQVICQPLIHKPKRLFMAGGDTISVALLYYWNWGNHHN